MHLVPRRRCAFRLSEPPQSPPRFFRAAGSIAVVAALGVAACNGCRGGTAPGPGAVGPAGSALAPPGEPPTVRLYVAANVAGALEPCGCTKDQLGGVDHFAAFLSAERPRAPRSLVLVAGPTFFQDPKLDDARATQTKWKAETLATSFSDIGLAAWTPGLNDWAAGSDFLASLAAATGPAALVAANLRGERPAAAPLAVREVGGVAIGVAGVAEPLEDGQSAPAGVTVESASEAMKRAVAGLKAKGAKILVGLTALARRDAIHIAEANPELNLLVVGKQFDAGEANDSGAPPELVGNTLVVQPANHLQTVAVVDFFRKGNDDTYEDGSGIAHAEAAESLARRIQQLETRLGQWASDPNVQPADLDARRRELERLRAQKAELDKPPPLPEGSYFRYASVPIRDGLGHDAKIEDRMRAYYRRVNDYNKQAFADRLPPPVPPGGNGYVGIEVCSRCHAAARKVWDGTAHAHAYESLSVQFKEFNLDCVSCHVTGYEQPGGSTVTHNAELRSVQCEQCHGPGAAHAKNPKQTGLIQRFPDPQKCVSTCHHPPHVEGFDPLAARMKILGPGHGLPLEPSAKRSEQGSTKAP